MHRIELEHLEQHLEHFLSSSPLVDQCTTLKTPTTLHKCTKVVGRCNTFLHFFFLTGSCVTLAKVKQIKAAALCYEVVLRCQQVTI